MMMRPSTKQVKGADEEAGTDDRPATLSQRKYWDSVYSSKNGSIPAYIKIARRILGSAVYDRLRSYEDHLLWNVIYPAFISGPGERTVIEIGSAPGKHLVQMHERFGYDVWGLDFSHVGVEANRDSFRMAGIDTNQVVEADLFNVEIGEDYSGRFDIVLSRGFIEHFDDPVAAIERHMLFLRPGGTLVVSIPNMRGANFLQALIFNRGIIPLHNRDVMRLSMFRSLFARDDLETLFCGYYGTAKADLFIHNRGPWTRLFQQLAHMFQAVLNLLFRVVFRDRGFETSLFSPNLLFIGKKR